MLDVVISTAGEYIEKENMQPFCDSRGESIKVFQSSTQRTGFQKA